MNIHHLSSLFPAMSEDEYQELKKSISIQGLLDPIIIYEDSIIDGRHRYKACQELGVNPRFETYQGDSPIQFVVSKNLHRRHLSSSQRAVVGLEIEKELAKLAKERQVQAGLLYGENHSKEDVEIIPQALEDTGRAREQAAAAVGTNPRYISDAKKLEKESPELLEKVRDGNLSIKQAVNQAKAQAKEERKEELKKDLAERAKVYIPSLIDVIHADCTDYLKTLPDDSIDLIVIDPPYYQVVNAQWDNQWDNPDHYLEWCKHWMIESFRVLKPTGSFYIWGGVGEISDAIIHQKILLDSLGFYFKDWLTWKKSRGMGNRKGWLYTREECLWYVKDNDLFIWNENAQYSEEPNQFKVGMGGHAVKSEYKRISNVWTDIPEQLGDKSSVHYTPKPLLAIKRIIAAHTQENDIVLDFFGGSGTTGIAAKELSRRAILVDSDEQSIIESKARLINA